MSIPLVALTGATGFIGRHLLKELPKRGYKIRVLLRRPTILPPEASGAVVGDLAAPRNMSDALAGVDAVIHSAGLAHGMSGLPEDDFRAINTEATVGLARAAARARVRRFVFLSSIRAQSGPVASEVLTEDMEPRPTDAYGLSKLDAERGLADVYIDWVAMRPVLVYGPGMKGNMATLVKLAANPLPLPFGSLPGRRSLLSVDNLVVAIDTVLRTGAPLRRPLIVAEPEALTIAEMITSLRRGLGRRPGLLPVPAPLLRYVFGMLGRAEAYERIAGSLVASVATLTALGWTLPVATMGSPPWRELRVKLKERVAAREAAPDRWTAAFRLVPSVTGRKLAVLPPQQKPVPVSFQSSPQISERQGPRIPDLASPRVKFDASVSMGGRDREERQTHRGYLGAL